MARLASWLLSQPDQTHLDAWGSSLLLVAVCATFVGLIWRRYLLHRWGRHPFQLLVQRYMNQAIVASSLLLLLAAAAHVGGTPVYSAPLFGALVGLFALAVSAWCLISWRGHFAPLIQRYEQRYPEASSSPEVLLPAKLRRSEAPLMLAILGGAAAYLGFAWHPWSHLFHIPNIGLGALAGFAVGSALGLSRYGVPDPPRRRSESPGKKRPKKRRH